MDADAVGWLKLVLLFLGAVAVVFLILLLVLYLTEGPDTHLPIPL